MTCHDCELALAGDQFTGAVAEHVRTCHSCSEFSEDLHANAEAFHSMAVEEIPIVLGRNVGQPVLPAVIRTVAAAALALAAAVAIVFLIPAEQKLEPPHYTLVPMKFEIPSIPPARRAPKQPRATHPLMVKLLTDDPNVVIYWQIDADQEGSPNEH